MEAWTDHEEITTLIRCPIRLWPKEPPWTLSWLPNSATTPALRRSDWPITTNSIWGDRTSGAARRRRGITLIWKSIWDGLEERVKRWRRKRKRRTEWCRIQFTRKSNATPAAAVETSALAATTSSTSSSAARPFCITSKRPIWAMKIADRTAATSVVNRLVPTATAGRWSRCSSTTTTITGTITTSWAARASRVVRTICWRPSAAPSIRRIWGPNIAIRVWTSLTPLNIRIRPCRPSTWASKELHISTPIATANGPPCIHTSKRRAWPHSV